VRPASGNEVKIKMLFAPINPADLNVVQGSYPTQPALPAVGGSEGLGQVIEVGPNAKNLKVGDFVLPSKQGLGMQRDSDDGLVFFFSRGLSSELA
jgi:trans-2-enoyl-CoA reductase